MSFVSKRLTPEKIQLIYEYDEASPLFVRAAVLEIENSNFIEAVKILEGGILRYPLYSTAYFILGLAEAYNGNFANADSIIHKGNELLDCPETLNYYLNKIREIESTLTNLPESRRLSFIRDDLKKVFQENEDTMQTPEQDYSGEKKKALENNLEKLAEELSKAKIPVPKDEDGVPVVNENISPEFTGQKIVSETLASIYFMQGNLEESIETYKKLIDANPSKTEFYKQRIIEIQDQLDRSS